MPRMSADIGIGYTPVCAQRGQCGHICRQHCSVVCHTGEDQINCSLREISNVVSRMTFRDIWSSSHSISQQKSLEQGSALLATLSLSDLLVLTHWSIDKIMPHMNFQTIFYDRCNFKGLTVPSSVVFKGIHFFLRLHLHLYFLKLNKWDLLFWEKRRNVTLYFITPFKGNQVPPVCRNQLQHRPAQANVCVLLFQRVTWCQKSWFLSSVNSTLT